MLKITINCPKCEAIIENAKVENIITDKRWESTLIPEQYITITSSSHVHLPELQIND